MHGKAGAEGWRLRLRCIFCREEEKELRRDKVSGPVCQGWGSTRKAIFTLTQGMGRTLGDLRWWRWIPTATQGPAPRALRF